MGTARCISFICSLANTTGRVGLTSDLAKRVAEHKAKAVPGFTAKYGVDRLVWFECHEEHASALQHEKRIKEWKRDWKINLIEESTLY